MIAPNVPNPSGDKYATTNNRGAPGSWGGLDGQRPRTKPPGQADDDTWSVWLGRARNVVVEYPGSSLVAGFILGGIVGWITSRKN